MKLLINISDEVLHDIHEAEVFPMQAVTREIVLTLFEQGDLPSGRSAEILGLTRREFLGLLDERWGQKIENNKKNI